MTILSTISRFLPTSHVWSFGLFEADGFNPVHQAKRRELLFVPGGVLTNGLEYVHTNADPFLFVRDGVLYVFYESVCRKGKGFIKAFSTTDLQSFKDLGVILKKDFHLSYPQVFSLGGDVYLLPESSEAGTVSLYKFRDFPFNPEICRTLLVGSYVDSTLFVKDGIFYLFATSSSGLELFTSTDPVREDFAPHPCSPITSDPKYSRCGGRILAIDDATFRIAQDCSVHYGRHLNVMAISAIGPREYVECAVAEGVKFVENSWLVDGSHHLDRISFRERSIFATDGRAPTSLAAKARSLLSRLRHPFVLET